MRKVVIVFGPPATGKTRNAEALKEHFGCTRVVDNWDYKRNKLEPGDIALCNDISDIRQLDVSKWVDPGVAVEAYHIDRALERLEAIR